MIRIVCPFCHVPLDLDELIPAQAKERSCLLCPECSGLLVTETEVDERGAVISREALGYA
jgi:uncharacterized protein YbaR (Trm112 family)